MPALPGVPPEAQRLFDALHDAPLAPLQLLRDELRGYADEIAARTEANAMLDASLAQALTRCCEALLDQVEDGDEAQQRLVQAALRYFIDEDDIEPDRESMWGLDDDAAVCNAVATALGRDDLVVTPR